MQQTLQIVSKELNIPVNRISKTLELFASGATIPFISRYRKEMTGNLDELQLSEIKDRSNYWEDFFKRKETVLKTIDEQGALTAALKEKIENCNDPKELEDIYLPFKPKKQTKGQKAIQQGLKPLAIFIQNEKFDVNIETEAGKYVKGEILSEEDAIDGALNILAEWIGESERVRDQLRQQFQEYGVISAKVKRGKDEEGEKYKDYFAFSERTNRIASHRVLAILRGEKEGILSLSVDVDEEKALDRIYRAIDRFYADNSYTNRAVSEAYKRVLQPAFESEIKKDLKDAADQDSVRFFASNLKQLLLQPPLGSKAIMAIDPGYRTGCKVAVLNKNGDYLENRTIYPHPPQKQHKEAETVLRNLAEMHKVEAIAVGDGTAGIETEKMCQRIFQRSEIEVYSVNESGASVYSASSIAREEFPQLDVTVRGAISIGRRLMDPLAELVKIDPKSIGVGQYQHDVNQTLLKDKLTEVVENCVNHVGVELNTASYPILSYISGLGPTLAKNIVSYREENGPFKNRKELLKVPKMGAKTFELAAGFLRIQDGDNPLDNTIIHPENYATVKQIAKAVGKTVKELVGNPLDTSKADVNQVLSDLDEYSRQLIISELEKPTRDPRKVRKSARKNDISSIEELREGMKLHGKINNITNFGAFVDIGLKESGLVHISEIADEFVKDITQHVALNQEVQVKVLSVDLSRKRIQLSMKQSS